MKIAGRDAGKKCIIISAVEKGNLVLIDGETRRKKCNVAHLEPLKQSFTVKDNATHNDIVDLFKKELKITLKEKKSKPKTERPKRIRKPKVKPEPKKSKKEKKAKGKAEPKAKKETPKKPAAKKIE